MKKCLGDIAEIKFHLRAHELGYTLSKPLRAARYDFLLDTGKKILRIQIKSTIHTDKVTGGYRCDVRWGGNTKKVAYRADQVDFIGVYCGDLDLWYIIPISLLSATNLRLYPHVPGSTAPFELFLESWNLLDT